MARPHDPLLLARLRQQVRDLILSAGWETVTHDQGRPHFYRATLPRSAPVRRPRPGECLAVELDRVTSGETFSLRSSGWDPYVATLRQWQETPGFSYEESVLAVVHRRFQPRTLAEIVLVDPRGPNPPLDSMPPRRVLANQLWTLRASDIVRALVEPPPPRPPKSQHFGPVPASFGSAQLQHLIGMYESIQRHGYRPESFPGPLPSAFFLVRGADWRVVLGQGHHRAAALRALGHSHIVVSPMRDRAVVDGEMLEPFTTTAGGLYPPDVAERLFRAQFEEDGTRRAELLGLQGTDVDVRR